MRLFFAGLMIGSLAPRLPAAETSNVEVLLSRPILDPKLPLSEVKAYTESRVLPMPDANTLGDWERYADRMRRDTLDRVVFRGEAANWRTAKTNVQWLETIDGGAGYRIRKLRYEALPGMWIPALLYEPETLDGKVPVVMNVNGHQRAGKSDVDKQIRCINQARRGMLALNVEWIGTGQLATQGFQHYRMNLKEVIEQNYAFYDAPEVFCFGLLEEFDIPQLADLVVQMPTKQERPRATLAQRGNDRERYHIELHSPWNPKDYLIINYPEHFSSSQGWMMYYREDIAPTMRMKKPFQWQIEPDGSEAGYTCEFENGIVFSVLLVSKGDEVIQRLRVHNGSSKPLRHLRLTLCTRLNELSEFRHEGKDKFAHLDRTFTLMAGRPVSMRDVWSLIPEDKKREGEGRVWVGCNVRGQQIENDNWYIAPAACDAGIIVVRSHSGDRHVAIYWPKCRLVFTNYGVPCIHADPELPDCPPGKDVTVTGKVIFHQGNLESLLKRLKPHCQE